MKFKDPIFLVETDTLFFFCLPLKSLYRALGMEYIIQGAEKKTSKAFIGITIVFKTALKS